MDCEMRWENLAQKLCESGGKCKSVGIIVIQVSFLNVPLGNTFWRVQIDFCWCRRHASPFLCFFPSIFHHFPSRFPLHWLALLSVVVVAGATDDDVITMLSCKKFAQIAVQICNFRIKFRLKLPKRWARRKVWAWQPSIAEAVGKWKAPK